MSKIAIFASGTGTNARKVIDHFTQRKSDISVNCIVTNRKTAGVYRVATETNTSIFHFENSAFEIGTEVVEFLAKKRINWIVLSGFLRKIPSSIIEQYHNRIINLHPSLLPKFGGQGMYGKFVHQAVLEAEESESGISIHLVNSEFDKGEVLFQKKCAVDEDETIQSLSAKIQHLEHTYFPKIIEQKILSER